MFQHFPPSGRQCASFKLGDLGSDFLNSSFHSFSANINELPVDFHALDSSGWDSSFSLISCEVQCSDFPQKSIKRDFGQL